MFNCAETTIVVLNLTTTGSTKTGNALVMSNHITAIVDDPGPGCRIVHLTAGDCIKVQESLEKIREALGIKDARGFEPKEEGKEDGIEVSELDKC